MTKATKTKTNRAKTWAAVLLAMLALPGCQATRSADASFGAQTPAATQIQTASIGPVAMLNLPSSPAPSQGYQKTGCMDFGWGGGKAAAPLIVGLILFSPILLLLSFLGG